MNFLSFYVCIYKTRPYICESTPPMLYRNLLDLNPLLGRQGGVLGVHGGGRGRRLRDGRAQGGRDSGVVVVMMVMVVHTAGPLDAGVRRGRAWKNSGHAGAHRVHLDGLLGGARPACALCRYRLGRGCLFFPENHFVVI